MAGAVTAVLALRQHRARHDSCSGCRASGGGPAHRAPGLLKQHSTRRRNARRGPPRGLARMAADASPAQALWLRLVPEAGQHRGRRTLDRPPASAGRRYAPLRVNPRPKRSRLRSAATCPSTGATPMSLDQAGRTLRVLITDDHALFRRGIREVIDAEDDMRVVAEAGDGEEAIRLARELRPHGLDVVLLDLDMPGLDGIATTRELLAGDPDLSIVILTGSTLDEDLFEAARLGAVGFLSKRLSGPAIVRALRDFHRDGALPMSRTMAARVLAHFRQVAVAKQGIETAPQVGGTLADVLTSREREVLELLATGARNREIAERLIVAENTVKRHVQ